MKDTSFVREWGQKVVVERVSAVWEMTVVEAVLAQRGYHTRVVKSSISRDLLSNICTMKLILDEGVTDRQVRECLSQMGIALDANLIWMFEQEGRLGIALERAMK